MLLACHVLGAQAFPPPTGKVNDFASLLPAGDRQSLEDLLTSLERETGAEVAVVTVSGLEGRTVEDYANRLFGEWGIGKRGQDNGVLILVARDDRQMRIEVGYGLEGILPDGLAGAIIRDTFLPRFRDGRYREGIVEGTHRVADIVRRQETLTAEQRAALDRAEAGAGRSWVIVAFLSLFVGVGAFSAGTAAGARVVGQLVFGIFFMGMAMFMALLGAPPYGVATLALFAVAVVALGYWLGRRPHWRRSLRGGKATGATGWVMGTSGGSRTSGGSGSGSGSFGGGRSGGGGASGRW
jgi:uncharacterized protein